jgi:acyl carrier protein
MATIEQKFLQHVQDAFEIEGSKLALSDRFRELPEWDSLVYLSLISIIDEEYNVVIGGETFKKLDTLEDVLNEIRARSA